MALRFRRGLDIERQAVVFVEGEPTYTTDNKEFFIGDGVTPGGIQIGGLNNLIDDTTPRLGGDLDLNNNNLIGSGDIVINGDLKITGSIDVGLITANYTGSLFGDDSTLIVDAINKRVYADIMALDGTTLIDTTSKEIDLSSTSLSSLSDVQYDNPSPGALLSWNGTYFSLNALGAYNNQIVLDKQLLQYDTSLGWIASDQITLPDSSVLVDLQTGIINLYNTPLDSHMNVLNNDLTIDDVLAWDGLNWVNKQLTIDNAAISVETLDDVTINNIQIGDSLEWNGTFWANVAADELDTLDNLDDVIINNASPNDVLTWDGGQWINSQVDVIDEIGDLNDVVFNNIQPNDVLTWNGGQWTNSGVDVTDDIGDLNDVVFNNVQLGDVLEWTGAVWTNIPKDSTSILNDLDDVLLNDWQVGDVLAFDGVNWVNQENEQVVVISDLADVIVDSQGVGDVLTWDGVNWVARTNDTANVIQDLDDVLISFPQPNDSLTYNGTNWVNTAPVQINDYTGTFQGDILGFDSTMIIDAGNNSLTVNQASMESVDFTGTLDLNANGAQPFQGITLNTSSRFSLQFDKSFATPFDENTNEWLGQIIAYNSASDGPRLRDAIYLADDGIYFMAGTPGIDQYTYSESQRLAFYSGKLGIGIDEPVEKLHVVGNAKMSGFVQFGSMTTVERDALTAENGMVIYNSTTNKFQGYANSIWVDLH